MRLTVAEELTPEMLAMLKNMGIKKDEVPGSQKDNDEALKAKVAELYEREEKLRMKQDMSRLAARMEREARIETLEQRLSQVSKERDTLRAEVSSARKTALQEAIEVLKHRAISVELSTLCFPDENVTRKWALAVSNELDRAWQELEILADIPTAEEATRG